MFSLKLGNFFGKNLTKKHRDLSNVCQFSYLAMAITEYVLPYFTVNLGGCIARSLYLKIRTTACAIFLNRKTIPNDDLVTDATLTPNQDYY